VIYNFSRVRTTRESGLNLGSELPWPMLNYTEYFNKTIILDAKLTSALIRPWNAKLCILMSSFRLFKLAGDHAIAYERIVGWAPKLFALYFIPLSLSYYLKTWEAG